MWLKTDDRIVNLSKITDICITTNEYVNEGWIQHQIIVSETTGKSYCILKSNNKDHIKNKFNDITTLLNEYDFIVEV